MKFTIFIWLAISFALNWQPYPHDDCEMVIFRADAGDFTQIAAINADSLKWTDETIVMQRLYYYVLHARWIGETALSPGSITVGGVYFVTGPADSMHAHFWIGDNDEMLFGFILPNAHWTITPIDHGWYYSIDITCNIDYTPDGVIDLSDFANADPTDLEDFAVMYGRTARYFPVFRKMEVGQ